MDAAHAPDDEISSGGSALTAVALSATLHCLTGCALGEIAGMAIGTALGFSDLATVALAVALAFLFGYTLTSLPLLRAGLALSVVIPIALASDTLSIAVMEVVDNAIMLAIPGAMEAGPGDVLFWGALAFALVVAGAFALPVNRRLIGRGKGHAAVHETGIHGGPPVRVVGAIAVLAFVFGAAVLINEALGGNQEASAVGPSSVAIEGIYPEFDPAETRYVSRCGRHAEPIRAKVGGGARLAVGQRPARAGTVRIDPGVRPGEDFPISVLYAGRRETYRVRCLPADFPAWRFDKLRPSGSDLFVVSFRASRDARPWVIVFDSEGTPRWWYSPETRALWAQVLSDGAISWARSFGDGYGLDPRMAHEVRSPAGHLERLIRTRNSIIDGHELRELAGGNFLVDSYVPGKANLRRFGGPARAAVVSAEIEELDPRGRVLWRWRSRDHIDLRETGRWWRNVLSNAKPGLRDLPTFDPVHINSIEPRGADEVVISTRHTDAVYGIRRSTGEILWKLGGSPTADSLRVIGDPARKLLGGQHDARIADDGSLSVYDNGKDRPRRPRVVFYRLRPGVGKAIYLGQLNDPTVKASHCCGSARQLEDGGWLVSWGDNPLVTAFDREGRVAFRLHLPASTFRAVPAPPGATTPAALDRGMEQLESRLP